MSPGELSLAFFFQVFVILAVCRLVGLALQKLGQPQAIGEMIAGILLGPSLFGLLFPEWQQRIFPPESLPILHVAAELGVALYMFLVGIDFNTDLFRNLVRSAATISVAGMLAPFALGAGLALWLVKTPGFFSEHTTSFEAMLFLGAAMSITAFPMLARIIYDRGLAGTPLGTLALAAGSVDDAAAWCVLAVVLATASGDSVVAWKAILGGVGYAIVMLTLGRLLLRYLGRAADRAGAVTPALLAVALMLFMLAAWCTDAAGIHAVFGTFLLGVAMPRGVLTRGLQRQLEPLAVVLLVPVYFAFSGLKTRLDLVNDGHLLAIAGIVLLTACVGKGVACWGAARLLGSDNRSAMALGALMNTRGLMELIILNIGLQKGIVLPALFSVMVLMAVVTTLMTSPVFEWVYGRHVRRAEKQDLADVAS